MRTRLFNDEDLRAMYAAAEATPPPADSPVSGRPSSLSGLAPKRWVTLEVVGRHSGRPVRFPLGMADWNGGWYLVSMLGEQCNWVQNVRAASGRATLRHRRAVACHLVEVPAAERPPILRRYLTKVPGARPHLPVDQDAPQADFDAISSRYPVFRVVAAPTPDRAPATGVGQQTKPIEDAQR